jgi:hypothetical protein
LGGRLLLEAAKAVRLHRCLETNARARMLAYATLVCS